MNILVINGSPRGDKSNTLRLTEAFLAGICDNQKENPPVIEKLDISRMDIRSCLGCFSCWKNTPGVCCIDDDMKIVLQKLLWADITIWSFPLYYFGLPGKLKTVIDRQLPHMLPFMVAETESGGHPSRYDMSGKKTVLISTCGFYTAGGNYDAVRAQFNRICGEGGYTALFCGEGELFGVPELSARTDEYLAVVRQAGLEYASGGINEATNVKLRELLFPRDVFERMADTSWGISQTGEKVDSSLTFTKQMAALYNPAAYSGKDVILDMDYTDIGKRYRIVLGKTESRVIEDFTGEPTTIIHTPISVWKAIAAGEIEGSAALMQHKYTVEGNFSPMLKWDEYFGQHEATPTPNTKPSVAGRTDMLCLLLPWIAFWVGTGIDTFWGGVISVLTCCLVPLVFFNRRKTIYDVLSLAAVGILAALLIIGADELIIMSLSYLAFGLMWFVTSFIKIPLSAEYSLNNYGGEKMLQNPIFIVTNRILTASWGVLYIITAVLTYLITPTAAGVYVTPVTAVLPALMGLFTIWFQKWYPRRVARGK